MTWSPKVEQRRHPPGEKGVRSSLDEVAKRIRKDYLDPRIRAFSIECLERARRERGIKCDTEKQRADVLLKAVQKKLWVPDAVGSEWMAGAHLTACVDKDAPCFHGGDCFAEGTMVLARSGQTVPVEWLSVGMIIWGLERWSIVEAVASKGLLSVDELLLSNGARVRLTSGHKVYVLECDEHGDRGCACLDRNEKRITVEALTPGKWLPRPSPDAAPEIAVFSSPADKMSRGPFIVQVVEIRRAVAEVPCWDIQTDDHRVYLAEHDVTVSNCDDLCVMLGSCMMSVGLYTMVVGHAHDRGKNIGHVLLSVRCEGRWHYADPSTQLPLGETVEFTRERIISLPNQKVLCDSDSCLTNPRSYNPNRDDSFVSHGTFVGVDGVPKFAWLSKVPLEWLGAPKQPSSAAQEAVAKKAAERGGGTSQADIEAYAEAGGAAAATAACAASGAGAVVIAACGPAGALIAGTAVKIFFAVFGSNEAARKRIATQTWQEWRDFAQKQVDATTAAQSGLRAVARAANDVAAAIKRDIMKLPPSAEFFPQFTEQEVYQALLARGMVATPGPDDIVPIDSLNKAGFYGPGERGFYFHVPCLKASGTDYDCVEHSTAYWRKNAAGADERVAKWFAAFEHSAQQLAIDLAVEGSIKKANNDRTPFSLGSLPNIQTPPVTFRPMRVSVTSKPSSAAPVVAGGIAIGLLAWAFLA